MLSSLQGEISLLPKLCRRNCIVYLGIWVISSSCWNQARDYIDRQPVAKSSQSSIPERQELLKKIRHPTAKSVGKSLNGGSERLVSIMVHVLESWRTCEAEHGCHLSDVIFHMWCGGVPTFETHQWRFGQHVYIYTHKRTYTHTQTPMYINIYIERQRKKWRESEFVSVCAAFERVRKRERKRIWNIMIKMNVKPIMPRIREWEEVD